jgi:hypothetical protein
MVVTRILLCEGNVKMRLTIAIREDILQKALDFKFTKEDREYHRESIKTRELELAREVYLAIMGESQKVFEEFPHQEALNKSNSFSINVALSNGHKHYISDYNSNLIYYHYFKHKINNNYYYQVKGDLETKIAKFFDDRDSHQEEFNQASAKLKGFLSSFSTMNQLIKQWPEGEPFYRKWLVEPTRSLVPAVVVSEINAVFGVPLPADKETGDPLYYEHT